jgi:hypothetical protein
MLDCAFKLISEELKGTMSLFDGKVGEDWEN